ncbi:MAG: septum formation initiator family protein [Myxococcales bacterium]|nr:septum formation initiator family protein [Myxococcales bacterium]
MHWFNRILLAALLACAVAFLPQHVYRGADSQDLARVQREQAALERENAALREDIARLHAEVAALRKDPRELERIARQDLNLIKPDEVVFELQRPKTTP